MLLRQLGLRNFTIRPYSINRPGRIFGNYDQSAPIDSQSESSEVPARRFNEVNEGQGRRFNESPEGQNRRFNDNPEFQSRRFTSEPAQTVAGIAFTEEALQDYSLNSFKNASEVPFGQEIAEILAEPLDEQLIEIKPDGSCYLPEIHYRRILTKAFGIGGWSLIPRGPHSIQGNVISREYALFANGRFLSQARGHTTITGSFQNPAMCTESVRSNSLMRCCKDLGIASSLWDNSVTAQWKAKYAIRKTITDNQGRNKFVWEKKRLDQY
jgi:hypothetical protein